MVRIGNRPSQAVCALAAIIILAAAATDVHAARTINSATLNGAASVTVVAGASITAAVNVTTDGSGSNNDWESTGWLISTAPPGSVTCENHGDHTNSGTYSETFSITAPASAGTYNAYFVANRDDGCSQGDSATFAMTNAVTVTPAMTINSATVNGGATTSVAAGGSVSVSYSVTMAGGNSEVEGTLWQIGTSPPPTTCADSSPDSPNNTDGTYTTGFTATAPTTPGTYNLYLIANSADGCGGGSSSELFTLTNAVTVTPSACQTFRDQFSSVSYSRNDGTASWATNWIETGDNGSAADGDIQISSNQLQLEGDGSGAGSYPSFGGPSIERGANLSGYSSATLTFDYSESGNWESSDQIEAWVSNNGGTSWTKIHTFQDDQGSSTQTFSYDISAYISSNFRLAFVEKASQSSEIFYIDNVQIEACSAALDHVRLEHSGAGVTCLREPVTVKACQNADCSTLATSSVSLTLSPSGGWYDAASGGTASDALTFTGSATRYLQKTTAGTAVLSASGITPSATNGFKCYVGGSENCNLVFADTGFIFAATADATAEVTIPTQTAGTTSSQYWLRAVKTADTNKGKACEAALTGSTAVTLSYTCSDPATCYTTSAPTCGSGNGYFCLTPYSADGTTAQTAQPIASGGTSVTMNFDANGNAPFTFHYMDVGKIILGATKAASGSLVNPLSGNSNIFVVKPASFALTGIKCTTANPANCGAGALAMPTAGDNPGAADASGGTFIRAGHPFSVTVTAKTSGGATTPSFGRETTPEWVKLTSNLVGSLGLTANPSVDRTTATGGMAAGSATLTVASSAGYAVNDRIRVQGAGPSGADLITSVTAIPSATTLTLGTTASTAVSGATVNYMFSAFTDGVASGNNFTWDEVGIITLTPSVGDYLGAGNVSGAASGNVGRFYPHHFGIAGTVVTRSSTTSFSTTTGSIGIGSSTLEVADATGIAVGSALRIAGAGASGKALDAVVTAVSGTTLTLSTAAATAVANAAISRLSAPISPDSFTYMDEPFLATLAITAYNASEGITANYVSNAASAKNFAKFDATTLGTGANWFNTGCIAGTQCMGLGAVNSTTGLSGRLAVDAGVAAPSSSWNAGVGTFIVNLVLSRNASPDGHFGALSLGGMPQDADGVTLPGPTSADTAHRVNLDATNGNTLASNPDGTNERRLLSTTAIRFGRLRLSNKFGSEKSDLSMDVQAQYWTGSSWVKATDDTYTLALLTAVDAKNAVALSSYASTGGMPALAETNLDNNHVSGFENSGGNWSLKLIKPDLVGGKAPTGSVSVAINLGSGTADQSCLGAHPDPRPGLALPWLRSRNGNCQTTYDRDPSARATFGLYSQPEHRRTLHIREQF